MSQEHKDILVVEDDRELNELLGAYVELAGFHYVKALDGTEGLRRARQSHKALIVLDIMLPDLDGFEVCRQLKDEAATAQVPILMLTALDRPEHRQRGEACGADVYMTKPFDPERLMTAIKQTACCNGRHNGKGPEESQT
jgi:DNA-binding response OmpR family regulator